MKSEASLKRYRAKRNFSSTPEPSGRAAVAPQEELRFVVQMHHASHLHYDFRLEADGVLKSWAVPKGPSLNPHDKRLAMQVEDHPLDYRTFEGSIPKGEYGAGEVVVWDCGTYQLTEGTDVAGQIAQGTLKFELHGKKLHGAFALVRMHGQGREENAWLLMKERDAFVDQEWRIADHPESVLSKAQPLPHDVEPMLATLVSEAFDDPDWMFEVKWDGYRALLTLPLEGEPTLLSRSGHDFLAKFPELRNLPASFTERPLIVDGEIIVLDESGMPSFQALQGILDRHGRRAQAPAPSLTFVVFDLLYGGGRDLRKEPLEARKERLKRLLSGDGPVAFSEHVVGEGKRLFASAQSSALEGIMAKRRTSQYVGGRSREWQKIKTHRRQECVIGGWTEGRGSREHFGALLMGVYEGENFVYAGSVGTGFNSEQLAMLAQKLKLLERKTPAFALSPKTKERAHWVTPKLVAEVSFAEWTQDGRMRQPVFIALRDDKDAREIVRERET